MANPLDIFKQQKALQQITNAIAQREQFLDSKERLLNEKESFLRQGQIPNTGAQSLQANLKNSLDDQMMPGNVGSINNVIWPYFLNTVFAPVAPNQTVKNGFTVSQEAAMVIMSFTKTIYIRTLAPEVSTYVDPEVAGANGIAPGLFFTIRDSSSARDYENSPIDLNTCGHPNFPTVFPRPLLFLPNSNIEVSFSNSHATNTYVPFMAAFGYRIRVEDAQQLLGTVFA